MSKKVVYPGIAFLAIFLSHVAYTVWDAMRVSRQWVQLDDISPLAMYFMQHNYFLGLSYGMAAGFTVFAIMRYVANRRCGVSGMIGGVTITGVLYVAGCFMLGCCGSPMMAVYLGMFGPSFLGYSKPVVFVFTLASLSIGYFWMQRKSRNCNCEGSGLNI